MEIFSADNCAFRGAYYRIVSSPGLLAIFVTARSDVQPLDLTYSTDFMGYLSRYRNYGGLWDIKSERGKDEGQGDDGELRIFPTAGSAMAFALATFMPRW